MLVIDRVKSHGFWEHYLRDESTVNELLLFTIGQGAAQQPAASPGGGLGGLLPIIAMFVIFYFFLIRPQQKRQKAHQEMLSRLKKGDQVVTNGGIIGSIFALTDNELVVEVADRVKLKVLRSQVNKYAAPAAQEEKDE